MRGHLACRIEQSNQSPYLVRPPRQPYARRICARETQSDLVELGVAGCRSPIAEAGSAAARPAELLHQGRKNPDRIGLGANRYPNKRGRTRGEGIRDFYAVLDKMHVPPGPALYYA